VTRDADLLAALAAHGAAAVFVSVTTLDSELARRLEPRAPSPTHRLDAISRLTAAGIPTGVMAAPVIPGLTDHELPAILDAARAAGAQFAGYVLLRLPHGLPALFEDWLQRHYPDAKAKILAAVRATRDGQINQGEFGTRMRGSGPAAERLAQWFKVARRRAGFPAARPELSSAGFRNPTAPQLSLPFA
jgi:DNA repair photolyase